MLDGSGLDTSFMTRVIDVCGIDSYPGQYSVVHLEITVIPQRLGEKPTSVHLWKVMKVTGGVVGRAHANILMN